jgi:hypothetical protein
MGSKHFLPFVFLALLLLAQAFLALSSVQGKSATYDEPTHMAYGQRALEQGTLARGDNRFDATMPVSVLNVWVARQAQEAQGSAGGQQEPLSRSQRLFWARTATVALSALLTVLVFCWARELFGSTGGLMAAFLAALCPNLLAHGQLVTTDLALTLGIFGASYAFWRWQTKPTLGRATVAAVALGLAQLTKVTALFLLPIFLLLLLWQMAWTLKGWDPGGAWRWLRQRAGQGLLIGLGALFVLNLGFGFEGSGKSLRELSPQSERLQALAGLPLVGRLPLPLPAPYVEGLDLVAVDMARERWSYCLGKYSGTGFPYYYLVAFGGKVPPAFFGLLLLALGLTLAGQLRAPAAEAALALPVVFFSVYLSLFFQFQIGLRHLLPIFPFLYVSVARLARWRPARRPLVAVIWLLLAGFGWSSLWIYPHYLAYFNRFAGGPLGGWRWLIDSNLDWGQDRGAARFLYPQRSPVPVTEDPGAPMAGRLLVSVNRLVGLKPQQAATYAWLRNHFQPVDHVGYSYQVFDVSEKELQACCADAFVPLPEPEGNLAPLGRPIAGAQGRPVERLERLVDGSLGSGSPVDAAASAPVRGRPAEGWFGIDWGAEEKLVDRVVAYPQRALKGPRSRRGRASEVAVEIWQKGHWQEVAGSRRENLDGGAVDIRFAAVRTRRLRLKVRVDRDHRGRLGGKGAMEIACLELAVYGPEAAVTEVTEP